MKSLTIVLALALSSVPPLPQELARIVRYHGEGGSMGHGAFLGAGDRFVTVAHLVDGGPGYYEDSMGQAVPLDLILKVDQKKDIAIILSKNPPTILSIPIAKKEPQPGTRVSYICFAPNRGGPPWNHAKFTTLYFFGYVAGRDDKGDLIVNGPQMSGCSGSPLINDDGEAVAVLSAGWLWAPSPEHATTSAPVMIAIPVWGKNLY